MSEYQRDTDFLRECIRYDDTAEREQLEESITQVQRDDRCVRRAVWFMLVLIALAMAGLCYSAIFLEDYPRVSSQFVTRFFVKVLCGLGLGSLICLITFVALGAVYRRRLDKQREQCRRLAMKILESRLGSAVSSPVLDTRLKRANGNGSRVEGESTARS